MSVWLGDADARVALRLARGTAASIKDAVLRAQVERLADALQERLDPAVRSRQRASNLEATHRYRARLRALKVNPDAVRCAECGGEKHRESARCWSCEVARRRGRAS